MPRTTALAVSKIVEVDVSAGSLEEILAPFIETAVSILEDQCGESDYSEAKFELIERWLAAHFYVCALQPHTLSESAGPASSSYLFKTGYNLNQTRQGQQAMLLDSDGNLASWNQATIKGQSGIRIGIAWGGTSYDSE